MNPIQTAEKYFKLSNKKDLIGIRKMFSENATYESSRVGKYQGVDQIMDMMTNFFGNYHDLKWTINNIQETSPGIVQIDFTLNGLTNDGKMLITEGVEYITVSDGIISDIKVKAK